jgi:hypothetical protein
MCDMYNMPAPRPEYLTSLGEDIMSARPEGDMTESSVKRWMRKQRVYSLAAGDDAACLARDMLTDPRTRESLECMLTAGVSAEDCAFYLAELTGVKVTKRSIEEFTHYFWDLSLLTSSELLLYLDRCVNGVVLTDCWSSGEEFALWKLGYRVEIDKDETLKILLHEATMRFIETGKMVNSKDTAMTAKLWSEVVFKVLDEQSRSGDEIKGVVEELKSIAIRLESVETPDLVELSNGNNSVKRKESSKKSKTGKERMKVRVGSNDFNS